ncbi:MAG: CHASE domain-containing protein [Deltaproteobacteria bacterium]|nr:CHASE domain-containing protein [Deltaproteobacteria bacterium]
MTPRASAMGRPSEHGVVAAAAMLGKRTAALTLAIGLGATLAAFFAMRAVASDDAERALAERARRIADAVEAKVQLPVQALEAIVAFQRTGGGDRATFSTFARTLLDRSPSLAALEFAEIVAHADRPAMEARLSAMVGKPTTIREPDTEGVMGPSPERERYAVLVAMEPWLPDIVGLDVSFEQERRAALDETIRRGERYCSPRFRLVEDPEGVYSVAVYEPEYEGGVLPRDPVERQRRIVGFAIALFRIDPLVTTALEGLELGAATLSIYDRTPDLPPGKEAILYPSWAPEPPDADVQVLEREVRFAGRTWAVRVEAELAPALGGAWVVLGLGAGLSLVAALALGALAEARRYRRENREIRRLGQYEILRVIAIGGMGQVFEARHALLKRRTALKVIAPDRADEQMLRRFEREVQATCLFTHPNTVIVFDYGRSERGHFYYAMEYIDGPSLDQLVKLDGPMPPGRVKQLLLQLVGALAEAHAQGFVHRDIKPQNVMVTTRGGLFDVVKVLDFGLVKDLHARASRLTSQGSVSGTPGYLPPEVFTDAGAIGPPLDVYAVGCVAHLLLTGHEVFESPSLGEIVAAHLGVTPTAPSQRWAVDPCFDAIILRCLAKDPRDRYPSCADLGRALERVAAAPWSEVDAAASRRRWETVRELKAPEAAQISHLGVALGAGAERVVDGRAYQPTLTNLPPGR